MNIEEHNIQRLLLYYWLQMNIQTKFPFRIPQSQPQEGDKAYVQRNFPQDPLTFNASINDPKLRVLTPPWLMHRPDEPCPYYAPDGEFQEVRGKVEAGFRLDYDRTNHEINVRSNLQKNNRGRIRQMKPNEYVDITDPRDGVVDIKDNTESFRAPLGIVSNKVERFNTVRSMNRTADSLNDYTFHSPNTATYNDHNQPILPMKGDPRPVNDSSQFIPIDGLKKYTDEVTIVDDTLVETEWENASSAEQFCPLKHEITVKQRKIANDWKMMCKDETVNREAFRRNIHERANNGELRDVRRGTDGYGVDDAKYAKEGFYFKGRRVTVDDRFADRKLYEKYTDKYRKEAFNAYNNRVNETEVKEGFYCQCQPYLDDMYRHILEARASAIIMYLTKDPSFAPWNAEWEFLKRNISKCNMDFNQLADDHEDVAYSLDKGKELSFRFRDKDKYMPLSIESYILAHEMAHVANKEVGHGEKFQELMHLIEVAAYMLQFIDLSKYPDRTVRSNGQEILSRNSIKHELFDGIDNLIRHSKNAEQQEYWRQIRRRVENNK